MVKSLDEQIKSLQERQAQLKAREDDLKARRREHKTHARCAFSQRNANQAAPSQGHETWSEHPQECSTS